MKILYFSPSNSIGGAELSLLDILDCAKTNGHSCYVALPPMKRNDKEFLNKLEPLCEKYFFVQPMSWQVLPNTNKIKKIINYLYDAYLSGWYIVSVFKIFRIIKKHQIQIVHTNTIMTIDAAIAAKISGAKHVWHIREAIGNRKEAIVKFPFQENKIFFKKIMNFLSSKVIANSKYTYLHAEPYFPREKLTVIYNSLPDSWFIFSSSLLTKKNVNIGIVANLTSKIKNHIFVIKIAKIIKTKYPEIGIKFKFFGTLPDDNDPYLIFLRREISVNNLSSMFSFEGRVHPDVIYSELIDILFHPFSGEGFGRIYIEAMGKCIPVVAVSGGGVDEIITDGLNGFTVPESNPELIVERIANLIYDKSLYSRITKNAYKHVQNQFSRSSNYSKIENIYSSII